MQITKIILAAATTAVVGSNAASIPRQSTTISDTHLANFRTWGAPGCSADNQGEYNFEIFDLNICFQFPLSITAESIMVENIATGDDVVCNGTCDDVRARTFQTQLLHTVGMPGRDHLGADHYEQYTSSRMRTAQQARLCFPRSILATATMQQLMWILGWDLIRPYVRLHEVVSGSAVTAAKEQNTIGVRYGPSVYWKGSHQRTMRFTPDVWAI